MEAKGDEMTRYVVHVSYAHYYRSAEMRTLPKLCETMLA